MFKFTITPDEGEKYVVESGSRDLLQWERQGPNRNLTRLTKEMQMSDLYQVAYIASKRTGQWDGSFKEFESGVELDVDPLDEEDTDPTNPDHSTIE